MSAEARLKELGLVLPTLPKPVANYLPYRLAGNLLFLAGQGPRDEKGAALTANSVPTSVSMKAIGALGSSDLDFLLPYAMHLVRSTASTSSSNCSAWSTRCRISMTRRRS
jgi:hypothetical protein